MFIRKRFNKNSPRVSLRAFKAFLSVRLELKRDMVHIRAQGLKCWLDKGTSLLGPGIQFEDGGLQVPSKSARVGLLVRRTSKPRKPLYPTLWKYAPGGHLRVLKAKHRRVGF